MSHSNRSLIGLLSLALIIVSIIGAIGPSPAQANPGWFDSGWIQTGYNNQSNPYAFYTLGSEQTQTPTAIGGKVPIVNKAMILAPWILVAIAFVIVVIRVIQRFRKREDSRPPHKDTS